MIQAKIVLNILIILFTKTIFYDSLSIKDGKCLMEKKSLKVRIIDTALVLFEKEGYHGVTVDRIVEQCGTSKGGFYHNFKSKDELLFHIHDIFISYVIEKAQEAYDQYETPVSRICAIIQSFTKVFGMYKRHITVFYQESTYLKGEFEVNINRKRKQYKEIILKILREGQASGDFRTEVPPEIAVMAVIGMINWLYKWFHEDGPLSIEEIGIIYLDFILHSLLTEKGMTDPVAQDHLLRNLLDNRPEKKENAKGISSTIKTD